MHSDVIVLEPGKSLIPDIGVCVFTAYLNFNAGAWSFHHRGRSHVLTFNPTQYPHTS